MLLGKMEENTQGNSWKPDGCASAEPAEGDGEVGRFFFIMSFLHIFLFLKSKYS